MSAILLTLSSVVAAEERNSNFALSIGRTDIKGNVYHLQGTVFKLSAGQRFSDYLLFEAGFVYYGEVEDTAGLDVLTIEGYAWNLHLLFIAPVSASFEPFGKIGVSKWHLSQKEEINGGGTLRGDADGEDIVYGAGFLFNVDHDSTIRIEYDLTEFDGTDVSAILLGFQHRY